MTGIDLIVAALTTAVAKLSETVVKDAYEALKGLLKTKFQGNTPLQTSLDEFEKNPEDWKGGLKASLAKSDAANDPEIMAAVQKLQSQLENLGSPIAGIVATQTGDNATQVNVTKFDGTLNINNQGKSNG